MVNFTELIKNPWVIGFLIGVVVLVLLKFTGIISSFGKSNFKTTLITPFAEINQRPPKSFPPLSQDNIDGIRLADPVVPEEIGLGSKYPQGSGVGMSNSDSNSFEPTKPGPLLTDFTIPESYGESSLTDPMGTNGAGQGARVLRIKSTGDQLLYQPYDDSVNCSFAGAYGSTDVQKGPTLINGTQPVNYGSNFNPNENLKIQASTGQQSSLPNCESWYPNTVKYGDFCITEGDIPYGQVVDNKVNPRLVSRWESYTGDYSREAALTPIDGVMYPNLNVLVK
jgi:hypothetical protein